MISYFWLFANNEDKCEQTFNSTAEAAHYGYNVVPSWHTVTPWSSSCHLHTVGRRGGTLTRLENQHDTYCTYCACIPTLTPCSTGRLSYQTISRHATYCASHCSPCFEVKSEQPDVKKFKHATEFSDPHKKRPYKQLVAIMAYGNSRNYSCSFIPSAGGDWNERVKSNWDLNTVRNTVSILDSCFSIFSQDVLSVVDLRNRKDFETTSESHEDFDQHVVFNSIKRSAISFRWRWVKSLRPTWNWWGRTKARLWLLLPSWLDWLLGIPCWVANHRQRR